MRDHSLLIGRLERGGGQLGIEAAKVIRELSTPVKCADFGRLRVYFGWRDPEVDGVAVAMSVRELRLVQALARSPREYIHRDRLAEAVDNSSESISEGTLRTFVCYVRRKLNPVLGFDAIEKRHMMGYRLAQRLLIGEDAPIVLSELRQSGGSCEALREDTAVGGRA